MVVGTIETMSGSLDVLATTTVRVSFEESVVVSIVVDVAVTLVLTRGGASTMIVTIGKVNENCSLETFSIASVKSKIDNSIIDIGISSKLGRLDNVHS